MELQEQEPQEQEDDKRAKIFGYLRSRRELFINGLIFLLAEAVYSFINFFNQIPEGFRENPELLENLEFQPPSTIIVVVLMFIGYVLIDRAIFGSNVKKLIDKYGVRGCFLRKFSLAIAILFVNLAIQMIILLFIL